MSLSPDSNSRLPDPEVWQVLGLVPDTATVKDIKSAYARLLKVHRPDRDPESFKKLRAAYEAALDIQSGKASGASAPQPSPSPKEEAGKTKGAFKLLPFNAPAAQTVEQDPQRVNPEPYQISAVDLAIEELLGAIQGRIRQKIRIAIGRYYEEAERAELSMEARTRALLHCFSGNHPLLAEVCTDGQLIQHLQNGEFELMKISVSEWGIRGDGRRLSEFLVSLNRERSLTASEAGALGIAYVAISLGPWQPDQAERLGQRAFPRLPTEQRKELTQAVDQAVLLGRVVIQFPQDQKLIWLARLRGQAGQVDWGSAAAVQTLVSLIRLCGPQWLGFSILRQILPLAEWEQLVRVLQKILR